mgnify:CR=1 FL=1
MNFVLLQVRVIANVISVKMDMFYMRILRRIELMSHALQIRLPELISSAGAAAARLVPGGAAPSALGRLTPGVFSQR